MLIAILPGILAFIVALLVFTLLGFLLSALLRWALTAAKFDERIARNRPDPGWAPSTSPTTLVRRIAFWGCLLLGLLIGVSAFDTSFATAATLPISLLPYLTRCGRGSSSHCGQPDCTLPGALSADWRSECAAQYARFLSLGVKWLVLVLTAAMALEHLEIGGVVVDLAFGILFGGIVLTLSLAVGLGSRELVSRSLESRVERPGEQSTAATTAAVEEPIRHF